MNYGGGKEEKPKEVEEPDLSKPILGIDHMGNLNLFIPMPKTNEIFARGMIDMARSQILLWYSNMAKKQQEASILATKTGFQRFKDKILSR